MSDQDGTPPRVWAMPEEPPMGTVVDLDGWRWRHEEGETWYQLHRGGVDIVEESACGWEDLLRMGPVAEVPPTPAEKLADRLLRLARHLRVYPDLVTATPDVTDLRLRYDATAADLIKWAESIGADEARLKYPSSDTVSMTGPVGGVEEELTCHVEGLRAWLDGQHLAPEDGRFSVNLLREFAGLPVVESVAGA